MLLKVHTHISFIIHEIHLLTHGLSWTPTVRGMLGSGQGDVCKQILLTKPSLQVQTDSFKRLDNNLLCYGKVCNHINTSISAVSWKNYVISVPSHTNTYLALQWLPQWSPENSLGYYQTRIGKCLLLYRGRTIQQSVYHCMLICKQETATLTETRFSRYIDCLKALQWKSPNIDSNHSRPPKELH